MNQLETLEGIRKEMANMRKKHADATKLYILKKTEYQVQANAFILDADGKSMAEKERKAEVKFGESLVEYKQAKAEMEGYDREFRNLDAQRSIIMVRLKAES